eukprot:scaffold5504_cov53-Cyclotella_meneghiniana.AAC.9
MSEFESILKKSLQKNGIDANKGVDLENGECKKLRHKIYKVVEEWKGAELTEEEKNTIRKIIRSQERGSGSTRGRRVDIIGSGGVRKRGCEGDRRRKRAKTADPSARRAEAQRVQEMLEGLYKQPDSWN